MSNTVLAACVAVAFGLITAGVALLSTAAGLIVAGVLLGLFALLIAGPYPGDGQ